MASPRRADAHACPHAVSGRVQNPGEGTTASNGPDAANALTANEAKKLGIRFTGHVPEAIPPLEASEAGQHSIEHLSHLLEHCSTGGGPIYDPLKGAALFASFNENQTWHCPTLIVTRTTTLAGKTASLKTYRDLELLRPANKKKIFLVLAKALAAESNL